VNAIRGFRASGIVACTAVLAGSAVAYPASPTAAGGAATPPNILVIVLDDLGIDQMSFPPFNWNAAPEAPAMPVLAEIASRGVSFRNFWATPECSPSRAAMLTGRHGFRTGVVTAITDPMIPSNQLHPSEVTVPKLLKAAGYTSGMLGKYHLGGGEENTAPGYGYEAPNSALGLDFYQGYWDLPPSVDTTIGGQAADGTYDCGTIGGLNTRGAACLPDGSCVENVHPLQAMAMGATPLLKADGTLAATCAEGVCSSVDFARTNAYYVWPRTTTTPTSAGRAKEPQREYLTSFISRRTAEWVGEARASGKPWLAFSTHSSAHTPIQPPPPSLTGPAASDASCAFTGIGYRNQYRLMAESVDASIGNMLVDLGLGSRVNGAFVLGDLVAANTMILVVNDNGTLGLNVLPPFSIARAKQTVYETGVRSPCIIAGPQVVAPGRAVDETVSIVDLFGLLCETAGVDWTTVETPSRRIDCLPMMPFLTNPAQGAIREFNFAVYRQGVFPANTVGPCVNGNTVIDGLIPNPELCAANGGCWLGGAESAPYPITNYCDLLTTDPSNAVVECGGTNYCFLPPDMADQCPNGSIAVTQPPLLAQYGVRRGEWKIVVNQLPACLAPNDCTVRLYRLAQPVPPLEPGIEGGDGTPGVWDPLNDTLPPVAQAEYEALKNELVRLLLSEPKSLADGNLDGVVDGADLAGLFSEWGSMGFWDATEDGVVNGDDLTVVLNSWGTVAPSLDVVPSCLLGGAQSLVREYTFDKGYGDSAGSGVAAISMGGRVKNGEYAFGPQQGLRIPVAGLDLSDYTIEMDFVLTGGFDFLGAKLLDFSNLTFDAGLYYVPASEKMAFVMPPPGPLSAATVPVGTPVRIALRRDGSTKIVSLAINGVPQWALQDPLGRAVAPTDGFITLFADDPITKYRETSAGRLMSVRILTGNGG
jgi:hypothetical protein